MSSTKEVSFVVPTIGRSAVLLSCLRSLRDDAGDQGEIILVNQGDTTCALQDAISLADNVVQPTHNLGFAGGTNAGIRVARAAFVATINDDAIIEPGWTRALLNALEADPKLAAAQGINLLGTPNQKAPLLIDGRGIRFNRWWQANQIDHGHPLDEANFPLNPPTEEVFGVSATAAIYRMSALDLVRIRGGHPFDETLGSYYEDVDLACRLHAAGFTSTCVVQARAWHVGSSTGRTMPLITRRQLVGNRHLVLARHLGRSFFLRWPLLFLRDTLDLLSAGSALPGTLAGWGRALTHLAPYSHFGKATILGNAPGVKPRGKP